MQRKWWKEAIIYQIYPRSFQDSNGDGIGDLPGLISRLDHVARLGIDVIWLNPIFDSPNDDNGYDISNYYTIHPEYGSMEDFDELLAEVHQRNMRLIVDIVLNHTSDEHPWFISSMNDPQGPYGDFYFWNKGKGDQPPNNWPSFFGGPAWTYVVERDAYYLHLFSKKQPDLNWENQEVRREAQKILKFWLDKGVDGFRLDVIPLISKRLDFTNADLSDFAQVVEKIYANGPRVHEYIREFCTATIDHYDVMTVGEGPGINRSSVNLYVGQGRGELNMIFPLDHMIIDHGPRGRFDRVPLNLHAFKQFFADWDQAIGDRGWLSIFLDNHDFPRMVSRFGDDKAFRRESAMLLAMLILTQRGTPCIYFGSEIGMTNVDFDNIHDYRDVETLNFEKILKEQGVDEKTYLDLVATQGRDNVRTPMQWTDGKKSGFTNGVPWIKLNPNFRQINLAEDLENDQSIIRFYQRLIAYRKAHSTLVYGTYEWLLEDHPAIFAYTRQDQRSSFLVLLNMSATPQTYDIPMDNFELVFSNYPTDPFLGWIRPWEACLYRKEVTE